MPTSDRILREVRRFAAAAPTEDESDRALVARFAASRDEAAFAALVRRHGPMVLGVCRRVLRHAADADDAFQATFLILVRRAAVIRDPDRLGSWLFGVAWRTANKLRTTRRSGSPLPDDLVDRDSPPSGWPAELDAAIARLPDKYRSPVVLCHLQGLSTAEAARRLGCPAATLATRLFRARNTLRRRLTALGLTVPVALTTSSVLHVPSTLAAAAHAMAAGRSIPPAAARLADGVFRSLLMTRIRWAAAAAVCLTGVGVVGFRAGGQEPGPSLTPPPAPIVAAPPAVTPAGNLPATVTTANFRVTAPSQRIARLIADAAERVRKDAAVAWLGKELPARATACHIQVTVTASGSGGATSFNFDGGAVTATMQVEGPLDRLLADLIPHEVTHVVLADHFGKPLPRWADEGIALLGESEEEQARHTRLCADVLNAGRGLQVKALLETREYPRDVMAFFAESFWFAKVLTGRKDRAALMNFVRTGMAKDWPTAAREVYAATLDELEAEMLVRLKAVTRSTAPASVTPTTALPPVFAWATADPGGRITVHQGIGSYHVPLTSYTENEVTADGGATRRVHLQPVTRYELRSGPISPQSFDLGRVRAQVPDGKPIDSAALAAALKAKTVPVVVVQGGTQIDKAFADLLKPDTLILVVPTLKADPMPPPVSVPKQ